MDRHLPYITTTRGMGGFFPILMEWDSEDECYYPTKEGETAFDFFEEAVVQAKVWAEADEIDYRP